MDDERGHEFAWVTPARNAVDEALGLTEDPPPTPDDLDDSEDKGDEPEPDER
jgi:hypothetical protein